MVAEAAAASTAAPEGHSFEFLLSSAWSEGAVYNNAKDFSNYIIKTALEYNDPVQASFVRKQEKE